MQAALDELRGELGTDRVEMGELVVLGASAKLAALRGDQRERTDLRRSLADRVRSGEVPVSRERADEVRASGWARE